MWMGSCWRASYRPLTGSAVRASRKCEAASRNRRASIMHMPCRALLETMSSFASRKSSFEQPRASCAGGAPGRPRDRDLSSGHLSRASARARRKPALAPARSPARQWTSAAARASSALLGSRRRQSASTRSAGPASPRPSSPCAAPKSRRTVSPRARCGRSSTAATTSRASSSPCSPPAGHAAHRRAPRTHAFTLFLAMKS